MTKNSRVIHATKGHSLKFGQVQKRIADFQLKILAKKKAGESFDELFEYIYDLLVGRDPILSANRRLTRAMLFYMYWNCDIGEVPDAPSN